MLDRLFTVVRHNKSTALQVAALALVAVVLRFVNLGYSNFQGDELRVLCHPSHFDSVVKFLGYLLGQREGPVQYVVTCAYGLIDPAFSSELAVRFPFAIANLLSLVCFVIIAWKLFGPRTGIFAGFLLATNGIFVGQARFVQYQSFVQLGVTAGIASLVVAVQADRWKIAGLYVGALAAAGALLSHFDGAWCVPPMAWLVWEWWKKYHNHPGFRRLRTHLFAAGTLYSILILSFYVEYARRLTSYQLMYWAQRFSGGATNSLHFFQVFNPGPIVWIYLLAILYALTRIRRSTKWIVTLLWTIPPMMFIELIFKDSRASAYDYVLPLVLVAGVGLDGVLERLQELLLPSWKWVAHAGVLLLPLAFGLMTYGIIVDHHPEYPWRSKTVLGFEAPEGNFVGLFGVPYNRDWREIGDWFDALPDKAPIVVTNENLAIPTFYLPSDVRFKYIWRNTPDQLPEVNEGIYFVVVDWPQSWRGTIWGKTTTQWQQAISPEKIFTDDQGEPVVWIYYLTEAQRAELFHG